MKSPKIFYVVSDIDKSLHFEWVAVRLKNAVDLHFILIGKRGSMLEKYLIANHVPVLSIEYRSKLDLLKAWIIVFITLLIERPVVIHTHLWIANLIGLTAAWLLRIPQRIYTRHHAMVHYDEHRSGLKWDKLCNYIATDIIAISENVRDILINKDGANEAEVIVIPHGFDFHYFQSPDDLRIARVKSEHGITTDKHPIIGVIARYTEWKGIQYIIPAFKALLKDYPMAYLILANAHGDYATEIKKLLSDVPPSNYREIRFESDLAALYKIFDVFVHVPLDVKSEAFGQTYVEPLISGVPSIFTKSGIAAEFVEHNRNAYVVPFKNSDEIYRGLRLTLSDATLRNGLIERGRESVQNFTIDNYLVQLRKLYRL